MLLFTFLIAQSQVLPSALQTVNLKITKIERCTGAGNGPVYVVTSEHFDASKASRVKTLAPRKNAITGPHMKKLAASIARDGQRVFVLPESTASRTSLMVADALLQAGVRVTPQQDTTGQLSSR